ncbi:MAG: hypothetical protein FWB84_05995 [Candidatus Bathyarchaeota archaeon]|uniref:hypothetical protein n=1 Tax=Candidatus Bathycorpusculum sp. TaxID=2994959 RepID=UPI0028337969|nr:hypothetical protein [Candidatus Termiticorpusculum sp.]MCL2256629.1 hypothetical protein [Candidatus Termiticorpusculum sp.]MCL2293192.1 hypothetical protein [Candidatus Termiticorpusculum sp.]
MNKLLLNKKHALIPVALILIATMLITPLANAIPGTTAYVTSVEDSYGVTNPNNVKGSSTDGNYAIFDGAGSKLVGKWTVNAPPSGAEIWIYGYAFSGTPKVICYYGSSNTGSWSTAGSKTIGTTLDWYKVGTIGASGQQYFAISNSGGSLYIDQIKVTY